MADLKSPRVIYFKGFLFLFAAVLSGGLLIYEHPSLRVALLLGLCVFCSARWYYFVFYVIQHYVDPGYKFAGIGSFLSYLMKRRS